MTWWQRHIPALQWLGTYRRADLRIDVVAGLAVGALLVPQSMAYATVAGLPPVVGLYASLLPLVVYAVLGGIRQLSIGPLATISLIGAAALRSIAPEGTQAYLTYAAVLTLLVGAVHLVLGIARLGWVTRFLSEPVLAGFLAGAGAQIIVTQLPPLTGVQADSAGHALVQFANWVRVADGASLVTLALGLGTLALLILLRRWPKIPSTLVAVVLGGVAVAAFDLTAHGVAVVGAAPKGLPAPSWPSAEWDKVVSLLPAAFAITLIGYVESIALGRRFAHEHNYEIDSNQELIALGTTNVVSGLFQGMFVTGAITRANVADRSGARTQVFGVVSAVCVLATLLFASGLLAYLPNTVLAAVVIVACIGFFDVAKAKRLWRVKRTDFWLAITTFVGLITLGLTLGLIVAIVLSLAVVIFRASEPPTPRLGEVPGTGAYHDVSLVPDAVVNDRIVFVRIDAPMFYANAEVIEARLLAALADSGGSDGEPTRALVIDCSGVNHIDSTAADMITHLAGVTKERGVTIALTNVHEPVRGVLDRAGITDAIGADAYFASDQEAARYFTDSS